MNLHELIAPYLGLQKGEKSIVDCIENSSNNVTSFRLKIPSHATEYTVSIVKLQGNESVTLQDTASAAAFYNAKYLYELIKYERLPFAIGEFEKALKIEDQQSVYMLFIATRNPGLRVSQTLQLEKLCAVADQLSILHAFYLSNLEPETKRIIDENYQKVQQLKVQKYKVDFPGFINLFEKKFCGYFANVGALRTKLETLYKDDNDLTYPSSLPDLLHLPTVPCHGELTSDKIVFDDDKVAEITNWENLHFGNVGEDLTYLIITSAETSIRRNHYMSIFRQYFYKLVDLTLSRFRLADLKELFKRLHKYVVLTSIYKLISVLESNDEEEKRQFAQRWETALDDAVALENGDYLSDNEDAFFTN